MSMFIGDNYLQGNIRPYLFVLDSKKSDLRPLSPTEKIFFRHFS